MHYIAPNTLETINGSDVRILMIGTYVNTRIYTGLKGG